MTPDERKIKIADLRKYHAPSLLRLLGNNSWYFTAKCPHIPEGKDDKHIGLFESEVSVGDDVYIEFVNMDYIPLDQSRTIYKWVHDKDVKQKHCMKKGQYMIPVSELRVVMTDFHDNKETVSQELSYTEQSVDQQVYVTKTFKSSDDNIIEATWKNGIPNSIVVRPPKGDAYMVQEPLITHIINVFINKKS